MSRISADDVRKVAHLARLQLPEDKVTAYTGQLERILDYVAQLEAVDTEGVPRQPALLKWSTSPGATR